jgi:hypothetical protein
MTPPQEGYRAFHAPRYRYLLAVVERHLPAGDGRVLDVGLSPFTTTLRRQLKRSVDTLGLELKGEEQHVSFDLNALADPHTPRPALPRYSLIVFAEVMEHLHTSPLLPLEFFREHLTDGGILIVQTPNAASLGKRLKLLAGVQPYEMIRADRGNPGHVREYTARELRRLAVRAGFTIVDLNRRFYFDARYADHGEDGGAGTPHPVVGALKNLFYSLLPPPLREGITLVLRKDTT